MTQPSVDGARQELPAETLIASQLANEFIEARENGWNWDTWLHHQLIKARRALASQSQEIAQLQFELADRERQIRGLVADNEAQVQVAYNEGLSAGAKIAEREFNRG